ncbi:MAG: GAF domain-containing protein [Phototrophicaceae bacterium]
MAVTQPFSQTPHRWQIAFFGVALLILSGLVGLLWQVGYPTSADAWIELLGLAVVFGLYTATHLTQAPPLGLGVRGLVLLVAVLQFSVGSAALIAIFGLLVSAIIARLHNRLPIHDLTQTIILTGGFSSLVIGLIWGLNRLLSGLGGLPLWAQVLLISALSSIVLMILNATLLRNLFPLGAIFTAQTLSSEAVVIVQAVTLVYLAQQGSFWLFDSVLLLVWVASYRQRNIIASDAALALSSAESSAVSNTVLENLSVVNEAIQQLLFNLDSRDAVKTICRTAQQITHADRSAVYLHNTESGLMELAHGNNLTPAHVIRGELGFAYTSAAPPHIVADIHAETPTGNRLRLVAEEGEFRAVAETPLMVGKHITGLLVVYHNMPYQYTTSQLDLLRVLANQITIARENAELLRALEVYASEMAQLVHLSRTSLGSLQPEAVASSAVLNMRQMFVSDGAILGIFQTLFDGGEVFQMLGSDPQTLQITPRQSLLRLPELDSIRHIENTFNRLVIRQDQQLLSNVMRTWLNENQLVQFAVTPLVVGDRPLGVILLGNKTPRLYTERDWQFIEAAANLIAGQVQNALVYNETREALVRRIEQLAAIEHLIEQISSSLDISIIIQNILQTTQRITGAELVTLAQIRPQAPYSLTHYHAETTAPELTVMRQVIDEVITTREAVLSAAYGMPLDTTLTPPLNRYPSVLAVPLMLKGEMLGVLAVEGRRRNLFTDEQAQFLQNLAGQAAISIANAGYVAERQNQVNVLTRLNELSRQVNAPSDRQRVAAHILETAIQLVTAENGTIYHYVAQFNRLGLTAAPWHNDPDGHLPTLPPLPFDVITAKTMLENPSEPLILNTPSNTVMAVPLVRGELVRELLVLLFPPSRIIEPRDHEALRLLVTQAVAHLESATLADQIQAAGERMRAILEANQEGLLLLDRTNRLIEHNQAASQLLGVPLGQYLNTRFDQIELPLYNIQNERHKYQFKRLLSDNRTLYLEQRRIPVEDAQSRLVGQLLVYRDITEEHLQAERRDEITHMLVHDLRSPLAAIVSSVDYGQYLLSEDNPENNPVIGEVLKTAQSSGNWLINMVSTLLDIEKDEMALERQLHTLHEMVYNAVNRLSGALQETDLRVDRALASDLPAIEVDSEKIERVLINLIDNASDYAKSAIRVAAFLDLEPGFVQVRVEDDGPGIPLERRAQLFEKFVQGADKQPRRGRHSGIGLTFCKRAIEEHGGQIWIADDGQLTGAVFAFTLPIKAVRVWNKSASPL